MKERTREIASQLRKTSNILVEIRASKNANEFIIGHRLGVENYLEVIQEEGREEVSENSKSAEVEDIPDASKITVDTCTVIVQEKNGESIRGDTLLKEASQRNSSAQVYIGNKFLPSDNWKIRTTIFKELQRCPGIELVSKRPTYIFRWNKDSVLLPDVPDVLSEIQHDHKRISTYPVIQKCPLIHTPASTSDGHINGKSLDESKVFQSVHQEHQEVVPNEGKSSTLPHSLGHEFKHTGS